MTVDAALALFRRIWWAIPLVGLTIALLLTRGTLSETKADLQSSNDRLAISNASVDRLEAELTRSLAEQQKLATDDAARLEVSRQALALTDAAAKVRQGAIDRLLASAEVEKVDPATECAVSAEVAAVWK